MPADAKAAVVAPSLVSDRYLQLLPAYTGGAAMRSGADIPLARTAVPVELDQITGNLDQLSVALGPNGANKNGALSDLLDTASKNLDGNGQRIHDTVADLSQATATLAGGRDDLFTTVKNLQAFTSTLAANDPQVRRLNTDLASVADQLSGERDDLGAALQNLAVALGEVSTFVHDNRSVLTTDVSQLADVTTSAVAKQKDAIAETLRNAPVALSDLGHAYDPASGHARQPGRPARRRGRQPAALRPGRPRHDEGHRQPGLRPVHRPERPARPRSAAPRPATCRSGCWARACPGAGRRRARAVDGRRAGAVRRAAGRCGRRRPPAALLTGCQGAYDLPLPGGAAMGGKGYRVTVQFADVMDLVPQSAVKVDDVTVGKVERIAVDGWTARVTLRVKDSVRLPANATAELQQTSLLGEKYVELGAADRRCAAGAAGRRRRDPAGPDGPQPRGRGGPRRAVPAAQRRRRRPSSRSSRPSSTRPPTATRRRSATWSSRLDTFVGGLDAQKSQIVTALDAVDHLAGRPGGAEAGPGHRPGPPAGRAEGAGRPAPAADRRC